MSRENEPDTICDACSAARAERDEARAEAGVLREALGELGVHDRDCVLSRHSAGRPTAEGGYEMCYGGTWYEVKPVNRTPKCTCGLDATLASNSGAKAAAVILNDSALREKIVARIREVNTQHANAAAILARGKKRAKHP